MNFITLSMRCVLVSCALVFCRAGNATEARTVHHVAVQPAVTFAAESAVAKSEIAKKVSAKKPKRKGPLLKYLKAFYAPVLGMAGVGLLILAFIPNGGWLFGAATTLMLAGRFLCGVGFIVAAYWLGRSAYYDFCPDDEAKEVGREVTVA